MAELPRNTDPNAPQNPPASVVNKGVRRSALWTYLAPIVLFFAGVAVMLLYWGTSPPATNRDETTPRAEGTAGTAGERGAVAATPGGQNPDVRPQATKDEIDDRAGRNLSELGEVLENDSRGVIGRRIVVQDVDVESVESPALFWVRDGNVRVAVAAPAGGVAVRAGQTVNVVGSVERSGDTVRIRASRVTPSQ